MKKITSLVLALVLLMCFLPGYAAAEELDIETDGTLLEGVSQNVNVTSIHGSYIFDFYPDYTGYYHFGHNAENIVVMGTAGSDGYYIGNFYFDSVNGYTLWLEADTHYYVTVYMYDNSVYEQFDIFVDYLAPMDSGWTTLHGRHFYWADGDLAYGWIQSDGNWYCINEMGYAFTDIMLEDQHGYLYIIGKDGTMQTGLIEFYGNFYYAGEDGTLCTGWQLIDGKWYAFHEYEYYMLRSTIARVNNQYYCFDENGQYLTGFQGDFYYGPDGARVRDTWVEQDGKWYYINSRGQKVMSCESYIGGAYFRFDDEGAMVTGWYHSSDDDSWYYYNTDGTAAHGWTLIAGAWYYLSDNGVMQTGWQQIDGKWYYLNSSMKTGWQQIDGKWYYLNSAMQTGLQEIDGQTYYLNTEMKTGWQQIDGKWYYFNSAMCYGWQYIGGIWYYLGSDGAMVTGTQVIDGVTYNFSANGAWIP